MKIVVKQMDELEDKEQLVYLMDDNGRPLSCDIAYGKVNKDDVINGLLLDHFIPNNWENNKDTFNSEDIVEEVSYKEYMELANIEE